MSEKKRIIIGILALVILVGVVLGVDQIQRARQTAEMPELPAGAIPIYLDDVLNSGMVIEDLDGLILVSFKDSEEDKKQEGWLLSEILLIYFDESEFNENSIITVSSSSREKSISLTWAEVDDADNLVMFDLSNKGTMKLISKGLEALDVRDEWIQDVDKIEIN